MTHQPFEMSPLDGYCVLPPKRASSVLPVGFSQRSPLFGKPTLPLALVSDQDTFTIDG